MFYKLYFGMEVRAVFEGENYTEVFEKAVNALGKQNCPNYILIQNGDC